MRPADTPQEAYEAKCESDTLKQEYDAIQAQINSLLELCEIGDDRLFREFLGYINNLNGQTISQLLAEKEHAQMRFLQGKIDAYTTVLNLSHFIRQQVAELEAQRDNVKEDLDLRGTGGVPSNNSGSSLAPV